MECGCKKFMKNSDCGWLDFNMALIVFEDGEAL